MTQRNISTTNFVDGGYLYEYNTAHHPCAVYEAGILRKTHSFVNAHQGREMREGVSANNSTKADEHEGAVDQKQAAKIQERGLRVG